MHTRGRDMPCIGPLFRRLTTEHRWGVFPVTREKGSPTGLALAGSVLPVSVPIALSWRGMNPRGPGASVAWDGHGEEPTEQERGSRARAGAEARRNPSRLGGYAGGECIPAGDPVDRESCLANLAQVLCVHIFA